MTSMPSAPSAPSAPSVPSVSLHARTLHALLRNEYSKMRHLRIGVAASLLLLGVCALTVFWPMGSGLGEHLDDPDGYDWKLLLTSLHSAVMCTAPILLAVMASRQTEIEHSGNGWLASATAGAGPGRLCRAKFLALGILVTPMPVVWSAMVLAFGKAAHRVEVDQIDADEIDGGDERGVGPRAQIQQPAGQNLAEDAQEYPAQPHAQR